MGTWISLFSVWLFVFVYLAIIGFYGSYSKQIVPAIYIFGDSTVDVGTNRYLPDCGARANIYPL